MNLAYSAAEYFIEAIWKSPTYSITYDFVKNVRKLILEGASQEIIDYLDLEVSKDPLLIFRKFPDIFVLQGNCICLNEAFLSVCFINSSYSSCFQNANSYIDNFAVEYFRKVLTKFGPQNLIQLFRLFLTDHSTDQYSAHFQHFSAIQAADFFLSHADIFIICNGIVHLNLRTPSKINPLMKSINDANALNKLKRSVHFLLSCFKSLHYIELKQVISYSVSDVKIFLDELPLIRQREVFEKLTDTKMDEYGFLSLSNTDVDYNLSSKTKVLLLITCILAFKKEMYIPNLVEEMSNRIPASVNSLHNKPVAEQVIFFRKNSAYFLTYSNFYVSLLPSFIFPFCSFKGNVQSANIAPEITVCLETPDTNNSIQPFVPQKNPIISYEDATISNNDSEIINPTESIIQKYSLVIPGFSADNNEKIRLSVFYLLACFKALESKRTLKTLLHVLDDIRVSFCRLSDSDKHNFITVCCKFMRIVSQEKLETSCIGLLEVAEKERVLLQVTYLLSRKIKMSYLNLIMCLKKDTSSNILSESSASKKLNYFSSMGQYINVDEIGDVALAETFIPIMSMIDAYATLISKYNSNDEKSISPVPQAVAKPKIMTSVELKKESDDVLENQVAQKATRNFHSVVNAVPVDELPENVYKILDCCAHFLRQHFNKVVSKKIIASSIFVLNDLKRYFYELSTTDQYAFVAKCHKFVSKNSDNNYTCILSQREKTLLFITYLLSKKENLHFQKIVSKLEEHRFDSFICKLSAKLQFAYFKNDAANYFEINGDGLVFLSSSYNYITSVINLAVGSNPSHSSKLTISVPNSTTNVPSRRTVKQSESCSSVLSVDSDIKDLLIDVCVYILSLCEKMSVEKLCYRLDACNSRKIQNLFPYATITDKLNFFKSLSEYFNVSKDGFVTLNAAAVENYVRKTSIDPRGLFDTTRSASRNSFASSHTRSESARSTELSEPMSPSPSTPGRRRRSRRKKRHSRSTSLVELKERNISVTFTNSTKARDEDLLQRRSHGMGQLSGGRKMCMAAIKDSVSNSGDRLKMDVVDKLNNNSQAKSASFQPPPVKTEEVDTARTEDKNLLNSVSALVNKTKNLSLNQVPLEVESQSIIQQKIPVLTPVSRSSEHSVEKATKNSNASILKNFRSSKVYVPRQPSLGDGLCNKYHSSAVLTKGGKPVADTETVSHDFGKLSLNGNGFHNSGTPNNSESQSLVKDGATSCFEGSETTTLSSNSASAANDSFCRDISKCDTSYEAYIAELIGSFSNQMDPSVSKTPSSKHGTGYQHSQMNSEIPNSFTSGTLCSEGKYVPNLLNLPDAKESLGLELLEPHSACTIIDYSMELKAINFFCILLRNYEVYERGVSVDFLKKHIKGASPEVQSFMYEHYKYDFLPFFMKHKKIFYVASETRAVYMLKKFS